MSESINPELESVLAQSQSAFEKWQHTPALEKKAILMKLFELTEQRKDAIAKIMVEETGKTEGEAIFELNKFGEFGAKIVAENLDEGAKLLEGLEDREPLGPIFGIMPFNLPFWQVFRYVIPTVMAGNTAIIKPDEITERSNAEVQKLFDDAGFPKGVITSINKPEGISSAELSAQAIKDDRVQGVSFTGSSGVGKSLESQCEEVGKPIVFEGGGSDPYIILPGADLDMAAKHVAMMRLMVNGQVCIACKRLYVHESIAAEFYPKLEAEMSAQLEAKGGPQRLAKSKFLTELQGIEANAAERGATIKKFGEDDPAQNIRAPRIVYLQHDSEARIYAEETFGPDLPTSTFSDIDEVVGYANDTVFGLSSAVYGPEAEAQKVANRIEAGMRFVNGFTTSHPLEEFVGIKESGNGKPELGKRAFYNFSKGREVTLTPAQAQKLTGVAEVASNAKVRKSMPAKHLTVEATLPEDWKEGTFIGRVERPGVGPSVVTINANGELVDITNSFPTTNLLFDQRNPATAAKEAIANGTVIGKLDDILANTPNPDGENPHLLSPMDMQTVKAAGVTFIESMIERTIEEAVAGDRGNAEAVGKALREKISKIVPDFTAIVPGTPQALEVIEAFKAEGINTAYIEVGLGEHAEIFTKTPTGATVGHGAAAGYSTLHSWTNPEPEVVLTVNSAGEIVGAALGNDINDRGTEGKSALLLGEAKDQNGTAVVGPFVRLFDKSFDLEDVKNEEIELEVKGKDGFFTRMKNNMAKISRPLEVLAKQLFRDHKYPSGADLYCGTMVIPTKDRDGEGTGFGHHEGDVVTIRSKKLGGFTNVMHPANEVPGHEVGIDEVAINLAERGHAPRMAKLQAGSKERRAELEATRNMTALELLERNADLKAGGPAVATDQPETAFGFSFGHQLEGTKDALKGKKILLYAAGDVWMKFIRGQLEHLGIQPGDITIIRRDKQDVEDRPWLYAGTKTVTVSELEAQPDLINNDDFDMAMVLSPPHLHLQHAKDAMSRGLPVLMEKPAFAHAREFEEFEAVQRQAGVPVHLMDWEEPLASTALFAALDVKAPFQDSVIWENQEAFEKFDFGNLAHVFSNFVEGNVNPLSNAEHREGWMKRHDLGGGLLPDMGIHALSPLTILGFKGEKVTSTILADTTDEIGKFERFGREDVSDSEKTAEWYGQINGTMSLGDQKGIPYVVEAAKNGDRNDMRIRLEDKNGYVLEYEFGHAIGKATLFDPDGKEVASAEGKGEPYSAMFIHGNKIFEEWEASGKDPAKAPISFKDEYREAMEIIEKAQVVGRREPVAAGTYVRQVATRDLPPQESEKVDHDVATIAEGGYEVLANRYWTSEGPQFDQESGRLVFTDIETGKLVIHDVNTGETNSWNLTSDETNPRTGEPLQMIGGTSGFLSDGNIMVILSGGGPKAGINYFNPETGELTHIGKTPKEETAKPGNRPNDACQVKVGDKNLMIYGTMNMHWGRKLTPEGQYQRLGDFYLIDPDTLESKQITFKGDTYPGCVISNGLAQVGTAENGNPIIRWSETVESPGMKGETLNVYEGELDPKAAEVSNIRIAADYDKLGGKPNGQDTFGRADGGNTAIYKGKKVYGSSVLETGTVRFFDVETDEVVLDLKLPFSYNTKFAFGKDAEGNDIGFATSLDAAYLTRKPGNSHDGINGSVIKFPLPEGLEPDPRATERLSYPGLEQAKSLITRPNPTQNMGEAEVEKVHLETARVA